MAKNKKLDELLKIIVEKYGEKFAFKPDYLTKIDSDPRWRTLETLEKKLGVKEIEWNWGNTDFDAIGGEPIVIEYVFDEAISEKERREIGNLVDESGFEHCATPELLIVLPRIKKIDDKKATRKTIDASREWIENKVKELNERYSGEFRALTDDEISKLDKKLNKNKNRSYYAPYAVRTTVGNESVVVRSDSVTGATDFLFMSITPNNFKSLTGTDIVEKKADDAQNKKIDVFLNGKYILDACKTKDGLTKSQKHNRMLNKVFSNYDEQQKEYEKFLLEKGVSVEEIEQLKKDSGLHGNPLAKKYFELKKETIGDAASSDLKPYREKAEKYVKEQGFGYDFGGKDDPYEIERAINFMTLLNVVEEKLNTEIWFNTYNISQGYAYLFSPAFSAKYNEEAKELVKKHKKYLEKVAKQLGGWIEIIGDFKHDTRVEFNVYYPDETPKQLNDAPYYSAPYELEFSFPISPKNKDIVESVVGQLSDGIWENSNMNKYWENITVKNGKVTFDNGNGVFSSNEHFATWYADKIKQIVKQAFKDGKKGTWKRDDDSYISYLSYDENITVADAYKLYDYLKGRNSLKDSSSIQPIEKFDVDYPKELKVKDSFATLKNNIAKDKKTIDKKANDFESAWFEMVIDDRAKVKQIVDTLNEKKNLARVTDKNKGLIDIDAFQNEAVYYGLKKCIEKGLLKETDSIVSKYTPQVGEKPKTSKTTIGDLLKSIKEWTKVDDACGIDEKTQDKKVVDEMKNDFTLNNKELEKKIEMIPEGKYLIKEYMEATEWTIEKKGNKITIIDDNFSEADFPFEVDEKWWSDEDAGFDNENNRFNIKKIRTQSTKPKAKDSVTFLKNNVEKVGDAINLNKHIWEGWTVQDFIDELEPTFDMIMSGRSWQKPFKDKEELKKWCMSEQPYYKKYIPDVVEYFAKKMVRYKADDKKSKAKDEVNVSSNAANQKIRKWYMDTYPEDQEGKSIKNGVTFEGLFETLDSYKDVYEFLGEDIDSIIRERIFEKLAEIMGVEYEEVYDQWLRGVQRPIDDSAKQKVGDKKPKESLPKKVSIKYEDLGLTEDEFLELIETEQGVKELEELISDYLSDTYGFTHFGFEHQWIEHQSNGDSILVSNIEWDTTDLDDSKKVGDGRGRQFATKKNEAFYIVDFIVFDAEDDDVAYFEIDDFLSNIKSELKDKFELRSLDRNFLPKIMESERFVISIDELDDGSIIFGLTPRDVWDSYDIYDEAEDPELEERHLKLQDEEFPKIKQLLLDTLIAFAGKGNILVPTSAWTSGPLGDKKPSKGKIKDNVYGEIEDILIKEAKELQESWLKQGYIEENGICDMVYDEDDEECFMLKVIPKYGKNDLDDGKNQKVKAQDEEFVFHTTKGKSTIAKLEKDIENAKDKLKRSKFKENFGQVEVRKLLDKYQFVLDISPSEEKIILQKINKFSEWCENYSPY